MPDIIKCVKSEPEISIKKEIANTAPDANILSVIPLEDSNVFEQCKSENTVANMQ